MKNNNTSVAGSRKSGLRSVGLLCLAALAAVACAAGARAQNSAFMGTWAEKVQKQGKTAYAVIRLNPDAKVEMAVVPNEGADPITGWGRWSTNGNELIITLDYVDGVRQRTAKSLYFVRKGEQLMAARDTQTSYNRALVRLTRISTKSLGVLAGTMAYRQKVALPPTAVAVVRLIDVTASDTDLKVVSTRTIDNPGQVPIKFILTYDRSAIDGTHEYAVQGQIKDGDTVLFTQPETKLTPVPTKPARMSLVLVPATP